MANYYYLTAPSCGAKKQILASAHFMFMNNIAISLFCLLCMALNPLSASADSQLRDDLAKSCEEYRTVIENPEKNTAQTHKSEFDKGLLWQVETPEGKINYLFGTMHSQNKSVSSIPEEVKQHLIRSKTLLMETIPNAEANQAFLNMMYFKNKQRLEHFLEPELLEELSIKIQDYGVAKEHANFVKPWAAFSLIGRPIPDKTPSLESNLYQLAQEAELQVKSLETMEEILSALDGLVLDDQITILKDTICNHEQILQGTDRLIELYLKRDLKGIVEFNNQPHHDEAVFSRFIQRILYDRNLKMLNIIEKEFNAGDVFVAVGASHLADEKGLLNELANRGYKLSAIY